MRWLPEPSLSERITEQIKHDVGPDMVKGGFESALEKAALGAAFGAGLSPELAGAGAIPGAVLGFVGGFAQGVIEAPLKAAAKGAWGWLTDPIREDHDQYTSRPTLPAGLPALGCRNRPAVSLRGRTNTASVPLWMVIGFAISAIGVAAVVLWYLLRRNSG